MDQFFQAEPRWRRRGWLALIVTAHVLAVWCWQAPQHQSVPRAAVQTTLTYILLPSAPKPPDRQARTPEPRRAPALAIRPQLPPAAAPAVQPTDSAVQTPAAPAMTLVTPPADPFALPPKAAQEEDALLRARRSAGAVDKQLRKEAWNPRDKKIANDRTMLAEKLAGAYTGSEGMTQESETLDDGRVMTRIRTGAGTTFCAVKENNALTGGRDPFRDGIRTKVTTCGR
ncbi:hypothetical protein GTP23_08120 [Pseudoduganella sp. FT93W]|uniref:Uncharacterized protein n=1 Tax=Duganella fentianensis TaxID=2692177 RepID=A0A845HVJ6_9BURK|nr:hypothetical protein [Duganella fentianensis]